MTTLMLLAVLGTGQVAASEKTPENAWLSDYGAALQRTKESGKPLLIVIDLPGNAAARVEQISYSPGSNGSSGSTAELLKYYVLCRVDADTKYGQAVAQAFKTGTLPYTAVIDKRGETILFAKSGQFAAEEWTTTLTSYWRGERPVSYRPVATQPIQAAHCST